MRLLSRTVFADIHLVEEGEKRVVKTYRLKMGDEAHYLRLLGGIHTPRLIGSDSESITIEYIEGEDLGAHLASGAEDTPSRKLALLQSLASIYAFFHDNGVLHMDPKPSNILIRLDGAIKIVDFQLSTSVENPVVHLSQEGIPYYWYNIRPPESFSRDFKPSIKSEIYTLGHLFYYILRGRFLFEDLYGEVPEETAKEKLRAFHEHVDAFSLPRDAGTARDLPPGRGSGTLAAPLYGLVGRMIRRETRERPESMRKVVELLRDIGAQGGAAEG